MGNAVTSAVVGDTAKSIGVGDSHSSGPSMQDVDTLADGIASGVSDMVNDMKAQQKVQTSREKSNEIAKKYNLPHGGRAPQRPQERAAQRETSRKKATDIKTKYNL